MTFGLTSWLKANYPTLQYEVPIWYPSREQVDGREWLVTNGLGGYSMGTVSGANRRRYHAVLASAIPPPHNRHIVLSRIEEVLILDGVEFELSSNYWESGVVSPTGYKFIESFACLPCPTWVFEIDGHYLVKQLARCWGSDQVHVGYFWYPDPDKSLPDVKLICKFLVGFRPFHSEVKGSSDKKYSQFVSPNQVVIILNNEGNRLCLTWSEGAYETQKQWWWGYRWPTESVRGLADTEDLYLVGTVKVDLQEEKAFSVGASFENSINEPDIKAAVDSLIDRQKTLIEKANLDGSLRSNMLLLASDQFIVSEPDEGSSIGKTVIEGYPWYNAGGRAAMLTLPGLALATRRFDIAGEILEHFAGRIKSGVMPNHSLDFDHPNEKPHASYEGADITLWWGWALYQFYKVAKRTSADLAKAQIPLMIEAALHYSSYENHGITVDDDGLLRCADKRKEYSWMDSKVEEIPITPRPGKAVELCALWLNFLETILFLSQSLGEAHAELPRIKAMADLARVSMQKFWNPEKQCLFDVVDIGVVPSGKNDGSIRCNQLIAISLPFRALEREQEKAVLRIVEGELLTSMGIRSLSPSDPNYQGVFGCGFPHPDQYHRDLCRHQGTAWPWLLGQYCDALLNVYGPLPETVTRIRLLLQPLFDHFMEEDCLGSISEMFDGNRPHLPRGCPVYSLSVAELMRWHRWVSKQ